VRLLILLSITAVVGCSESQRSLERRCTPVLQNILNIQDIREVIRQDFSVTTNLYKSTRQHEELWQKEKQHWLERENKLRKEVTHLYDYAYETGCLK
jgi:BMFP domain-containing protein YqiC